MEKEIALVYMVAGISSRFGGKIKPFAQVGHDGENLIEYSLKQALPAGFKKIIFIVGNSTEKPFKDFFGESYHGIPVLYALQKYNPETRDRPWGTTDAICSIKNTINCNFVICNGDDLYGKNNFKLLVEHLKKSNGEATEATIGFKLDLSLPEQGIVNRGIFKIKDNYVESLDETLGIGRLNLPEGLTLENLCSMNIFALHPQIIDLLCSKLQKFKKQHEGDRKAECLLPNMLSDLIKEGKIKIKVYSSIDKPFGITSPKDEEVVRNKLREEAGLE